MPQNSEVNVLKNYQEDQKDTKTIAKATKLINPLLYRIILITNFFINITILLTWVIWSLGFKNKIDEFIINNLNQILNINGYESKLNYDLLTIILLIFVAIGTTFMILPLFFFTKKNIWSAIISLITIAYCISILIFFFNICHLILLKQQNYDGIIEMVKQYIVFVVMISIIAILATISLICNFMLFFTIIWKNANNATFDGKKTKLVIPEIKIIVNSDQHRQNNEQINDNNNTITPVLQWTNNEIDAVWDKAIIIKNYNKNLYRQDYAGAVIFRNSFKNHVTAEVENNVSSYNWTIALRVPISKGGTRDIDNLIPSHTLNFLAKGDDHPQWETTVSFNGKENSTKKQSWKDY